MTNRLPLRNRFSLGQLRFGQPVTFRAVMGRKEPLAPSRIPGPLKKARRIEVGEEIRGGLLIEIANFNVPLAHRRPHSWRVIPHGGGQRGRREVAVNTPAEIGANRPALAIDAMTLYAVKSLE